MTNKKTKVKTLSDEAIAALETQIKARKRDLFNGLISSLARADALNDLTAVSTLLDESQRQEEALNRVHATIGAVMMQRARDVKETRNKRLKAKKEDV